MQELTGLVERLGNLVDDLGAWSISSEEVLTLLRVDPVVFWRSVHGVRDRIGFADAIDGWSQETAGDLVTVLESIYGRRAEQALTRAGLFVPWSLGVGLIEELLFRARRFSAAHKPRTDELEAMVRHAGSVRGAVEIYLDAHVDLDALIVECADSFRIMEKLHPIGGVTAAAWLRRMFSRHVLDRRSLLVGLEERLRLAAALVGFIDPEDQPRAWESEPGGESRESSRQRWARTVMGFSRAPFTAASLRARYRELMMRYHPDADPAGLERCKDVNVAYALLISDTAERA
ncbi:MAG: J domain-containing protein [Spirochaetia bacterium]